MKKSLSAAFVVAVLGISLVGQAALAKGLDVSVTSQGEGNGRVAETGFWGRLKNQTFLGVHNDDDEKSKGGDDSKGKGAEAPKVRANADADVFLGFGAGSRLLEKNDKSGNDSAEDKNDDRTDASTTAKMDHTGIRAVARVTAISGGTITATRAIGSSDATAHIVTNADTDFSLGNGNDASLSDVQVGEVISFGGTVTARDGKNFTLTASKVRVWGDIDFGAKARVTGTVTSVNDDDKQLVITTDNNETITVDGSAFTVVKGDDGERSSFADIAVGATVKVKGWWNSFIDGVHNSITAVKIHIL